VRLTAEIRYPADPSVVFAMLIDPAFQAAKCRATGALDHLVEVTDHANGGATIVSRRDLPADRVPDFVKGMVGPTLRVVEIHNWEPAAAGGRRTGKITVEIPGAPIRFAAAVVLAGLDGGTHQEIAGDLRASIPFIGGRIERAAEPAIRSAIAVEQRTGTAWLGAR
jgi:hypothetical protein